MLGIIFVASVLIFSPFKYFNEEQPAIHVSCEASQVGDAIRLFYLKSKIFEKLNPDIDQKIIFVKELKNNTYLPEDFKKNTIQLINIFTLKNTTDFRKKFDNLLHENVAIQNKYNIPGIITNVAINNYLEDILNNSNSQEHVILLKNIQSEILSNTFDCSILRKYEKKVIDEFFYKKRKQKTLSFILFLNDLLKTSII